MAVEKTIGRAQIRPKLGHCSFNKTSHVLRITILRTHVLRILYDASLCGRPRDLQTSPPNWAKTVIPTDTG